MDDVIVRSSEHFITVEIPIHFLAHLQENRLDVPLQILDVNKMRSWVEQNLATFTTDGKNDTPHFWSFLNDMFVEAYAQSSWLNGIYPNPAIESEENN
jgi:hypothetical protein